MRALFSALLLALLTAAQGFAADGASVNDCARFLAGMPVRDSPISALAQDRVWMEHATGMDAAWGKQEQRQLSRVRAWAAANVPGSRDDGTMYYMFSGPDFLYANAVFPNATTYILCGTEPVGAVPDLSTVPPDQIEGALQGLRQSMKTILSFHYFITKDMRVDLNRTKLGGTLPIILVFLARTGHTIHDITFVKSPAQGVRISFAGGGGGPQTLYYFKTDLSNGGGSGPFLKWCAEQGPGMSLLKAASYLMHTDGFSTVRSFLLNNSSVLVQDDSGIPYRNLNSGRFNLRLFGRYEGTIELFAKNFQPDLAQAYAASHPPDLGFAFSYHWQAERGMAMVATRK